MPRLKQTNARPTHSNKQPSKPSKPELVYVTHATAAQGVKRRRSPSPQAAAPATSKKKKKAVTKYVTEAEVSANKRRKREEPAAAAAAAPTKAKSKPKSKPKARAKAAAHSDEDDDDDDDEDEVMRAQEEVPEDDGVHSSEEEAEDEPKALEEDDEEEEEVLPMADILGTGRKAKRAASSKPGAELTKEQRAARRKAKECYQRRLNKKIRQDEAVRRRQQRPVPQEGAGISKKRAAKLVSKALYLTSDSPEHVDKVQSGAALAIIEYARASCVNDVLPDAQARRMAYRAYEADRPGFADEVPKTVQEKAEHELIVKKKYDDSLMLAVHPRNVDEAFKNEFRHISRATPGFQAEAVYKRLLVPIFKEVEKKREIEHLKAVKIARFKDMAVTIVHMRARDRLNELTDAERMLLLNMEMELATYEKAQLKKKLAVKQSAIEHAEKERAHIVDVMLPQKEHEEEVLSRRGHDYYTGKVERLQRHADRAARAVETAEEAAPLPASAKKKERDEIAKELRRLVRVKKAAREKLEKAKQKLHGLPKRIKKVKDTIKDKRIFASQTLVLRIAENRDTVAKLKAEIKVRNETLEAGKIEKARLTPADPMDESEN